MQALSIRRAFYKSTQSATALRTFAQQLRRRRLAKLLMLEKYTSKLNLSRLKIVQQGNENQPELLRPLRLSIFTQFYPPDYAATGQLIEELTLHLARLGIYVQVFTGQPGYAFQKASAPPRERLDKILIRRSRTSRLFPSRIRGKAINGLLFCLRSALHLLKSSSRGDILLLTSAPPFLQILGYLANLFSGIPYVCLVYDLYPDVAVQLKAVSKKHWSVQLWNWINKQVWKRAQSIVVLSFTMKDRMQAKCPEISDKISIIHNWANPDWIVPIAKQNNWFAHKYDLVSTFTVLYSGNMGRCHDMDTILEAARELQNELIQFVFIGDGAKHQTFVEQVSRLGLSNCRFLLYQEKQVLPYSLTACDLSLVSISPGLEGLVAPSKLYGILAAGRPVAVICEPHSYLRRIVVEADCGAAFNNGDGTGLAKFIRRLATDTQLGHQMGIAGRRYLQSNFTPEIIAKQYSKLLCQAVLEARRRTEGIDLEAFPLTSFANSSLEIPKEDIKHYDANSVMRNREARELEVNRKLIQSHRELEVYQLAFEAAMRIFELTKGFPIEEQYSLTDQIRRSSRSMCANLTEAWRKRHYKGAFVAKLSDSEAEAAETQMWIEFAIKCNYLDTEIGGEIYQTYNQILSKLVKMINNPSPWLMQIQGTAFAMELESF